MNVFTLIGKTLPQDKVSTKKTSKSVDVTVSSRDRVAAKKKLEETFKKQKIPFKNVYKKSKSSSIEVLELNGGIDIIFKPIRAKGAGGLSFEKELQNDLTNWFNGVEEKELRHPDVIKEMRKELKIKPNDGYRILHEGFKNQKRELRFDGKKINITNSMGETLSDLTLSNGRKKLFLSLKTSKTYYVTSSSIFRYFLDKQLQVPINEYFGFDGAKIGGFGKEYTCVTREPNYSRVKQNLADLLSNAIGAGLVIIHKKITNDVMVEEVDKSYSTVVITGLSEDSYSYPEKNVRKYANIRVLATVNGHRYTVNFQFRGTTGVDTGPRYLRILMERH